MGSIGLPDNYMMYLQVRFYLRTGASTTELTAGQTHDYVGQRFVAGARGTRSDVIGAATLTVGSKHG